MSRIALYRKYRSVDFKDVVGQQHVTRTLEAAVERGIISHAYLLTGPRGTGKTSIARILARRVNALPADADIERELDIIEIDAASNRGIDEIRALREKIVSAPSSLPYKVYIIDEVHMLTREAFNALLKTLEEPPTHALFVLATTEAHKLPETIISRTQRFDLRPITTVDLVSRLAEIAKSEDITIETEALEMIARASRGGFRDAIGLLDQLSVLNEKLAVEHVAAMLGMASLSDITELIQAIADGDDTRALTKLETLILAGNDPQGLTAQLLDEVRADLLQGVQGRDDRESILSVDKAAWTVECLTRAMADFKISQHYSLPLELALYRASSKFNNSAITPTASLPAKPATPVVQSRPKVAPVASESTAAKNRADVDDQSLCTKGLSLIKDRNNSLYAVMRSANPHIEGDKLVLECRFSFHKERIEEQKNRQLIEQIMSKALSRDIMLDCRLTKTSEKQESVDSGQELVASALEILGGEVING